MEPGQIIYLDNFSLRNLSLEPTISTPSWSTDVLMGIPSLLTHEILGSELWDEDARTGTNADSWSVPALSDNEISVDNNTIKIEYVDNSDGAYVGLRDSHDLSSNLTIGRRYKFQCDAKVNTGAVTLRINDGGGVTDKTIGNTSFETHQLYFTAQHATGSYFRVQNMGESEIVHLDNLSLRESSAISWSESAPGSTSWTEVTPDSEKEFSLLPPPAG